MFTLYSADVIGNPGNCSYPHKQVILDEDSLKTAISHDYVCAEYKNSYRSGNSFIGSDCLPVDCDNDHSENPEDWITPEDVMQAFPNVTFAVHYSRSHNKVKNGKPARPKFHVLFPINYVTDSTLYRDMKKLVNSIFPYFDTKALDAARFFFGTSAADVALYPGRINLTEYLNEDIFDEDMIEGQYDGASISEGSRNATMSRFAGRVIKKYGDGDKAHQLFEEEAEKCTPPLDSSELATIWRSAQRFYARIQQQDGYVPPEVYNDTSCYKPEDYSDVGQAEVLAKYFSNELRYSPSTHFIRYSDHYWQESEPGAQAVAHELTRRQLKEANNDLMHFCKRPTPQIFLTKPESRTTALFRNIMLRIITRRLFRRTSSCGYRKNWYADEWSKPVQTVKNAVTAVITVLHSLLFVASAVKCSAESIGTTEVVNP